MRRMNSPHPPPPFRTVLALFIALRLMMLFTMLPRQG